MSSVESIWMIGFTLTHSLTKVYSYHVLC